MPKIKITHISDANGKTNEDSFAVIQRGDRAILAIADGIGGLDQGEIASRYLTMYVEAWAENLDLESMGRMATIREFKSLMLKLHDDLLAIGDEKNCHLGSTLIVAIVGNNKVIAGAVGDSRMYVRRESTVVQITKDQTVAEYERESGIEVTTVPEYKKEHTLCEWLGYGKNEPNPVIYECDIEEAADILLCTDGLSNSLSEKEIYTQLKKKQSGQKALSALVEKAKENGETDNITAVLFRRRRDKNSAPAKPKEKERTGTGKLV